jgi:hypothetical protein
VGSDPEWILHVDAARQMRVTRLAPPPCRDTTVDAVEHACIAGCGAAYQDHIAANQLPRQNGSPVTGWLGASTESGHHLPMFRVDIFEITIPRDTFSMSDQSRRRSTSSSVAESSQGPSKVRKVQSSGSGRIRRAARGQYRAAWFHTRSVDLVGVSRLPEQLVIHVARAS